MENLDDYDWENLTKGQAFEILYDEVRAIASLYFRKERPGHTLSPTAVAHEVYLRFENVGCSPGHNRTETLAKISLLIIRVLQDHHRKKNTQKGGAGWQRVTLQTDVGLANTETIDFVDLDFALDALERSGPTGLRKKHLVLFHFVAGLTFQEIATLIDEPVSTVRRDWEFSRSFLMSHLNGFRPL